MYNANKPSPDELPSSRRLLRSTAVAMFGAAAILLTVVLPAEYGIDPTGAGGVLGLSEMGEIKMQLAEEAETDRRLAAQAQVTPGTPAPPRPTPPDEAERAAAAGPAPVPAERPAGPAVAGAEAPPPAGPDARSDEISITLSPGQGTEVKLVMDAGARARFEWTANGGLLNYDTHGDGGGQSISYEKGRGVGGDSGELVAAFDGNHGWFWRNRTARDVTLTLRTNGAYRELKRVL